VKITEHLFFYHGNTINISSIHARAEGREACVKWMELLIQSLGMDIAKAPLLSSPHSCPYGHFPPFAAHDTI
jgi:hypothetical protein